LEIRKGAAEIKLEADQAADRSKEILQASVRELEVLADEVKKGAINSVKKLDEAFEEAYRALAQRDSSKALRSWGVVYCWFASLPQPATQLHP
jgi:hypothetical protein